MNSPLLNQTGKFRKRFGVNMCAVVLAVLLCLSAACASKQTVSGPVRRFHVSGKVLAVNAKNRTATIDAAAIPNYMEAMTMEYPIESKTDFQTLHPGDRITGTLNVQADDTYTLTNIQKQNAK